MDTSASAVETEIFGKHGSVDPHGAWIDTEERAVARTLVARIPGVDAYQVVWSPGDVPLDQYVFISDIADKERTVLTAHRGREDVVAMCSMFRHAPWIISINVRAGSKMVPLTKNAFFLPFDTRLQVERIIQNASRDAIGRDITHVMCCYESSSSVR